MMIAKLCLQVKQDHDIRPPGWVMLVVVALLAAGDCLAVSGMVDIQQCVMIYIRFTVDKIITIARSD
jgi:uncharacterized membrane protein YhaH (DUF805 family)